MVSLEACAAIYLAILALLAVVHCKTCCNENHKLKTYIYFRGKKKKLKAVGAAD